MSKIQKAIDALDGCDEYSLRHHISEISILIEGYAEAQSELAALREELAKANADKEAYAQNAIDLRTSLDAVNLNLSRADEALQTRTADLLACGTRRKAAEQRNAELNGLLRELRNSAYTKGGISLAAYIDPHIKPAESGASE